MASPAAPREPIVIGFGGNVGGDAVITARFQRARDALSALGELRSAPLYRTAAIGPPQAAYLNTAVRLSLDDLQPPELLAVVQEVEHLLGRDRHDEPRWGPRQIDLDVLLWGQRELRTPDLEVPHPRLAERRFALAPLVDLLGDYPIPRLGSAAAALARVADQQLDWITDRW